MDPLSPTASVLAVALAAFHGTQLLLTDLRRISDAPKTLERLKNDVQSFRDSLSSLKRITDDQWSSLGRSTIDQMKAAIKTCENSCTTFHVQLKSWTRHSEQDEDQSQRLELRDRLNVGVFKQPQIKAMSGELQTCRSSLGLMVETATLRSSLQGIQNAEALKKTIATKESTILNTVTATNNRLADIEVSLTQVQNSVEQQRQDNSEECYDLKASMKQLQEEAAGLRASHQLLEELLATVKETAEASQIASIASERSEMPPSPFSTIPFPRDPDYIDRSWLIDQLNEKLCVPHAKVALQGLGGIGKSQLAVEYAYRVKERSEDTWILWIHSSSVVRFEQSVRGIVDRLKISRQDSSRRDIFTLFRSWLRDQTKGKWLLILDNADDPSFLVNPQANSDDPQQAIEPLIDYLPVHDHGSILITTRSKDAALKLVEDRDILEVQPMDEEPAVALLEKKLGRSHERADLTNFAAALGFIPLAISQAAALIKQRTPRYSVQRYLRDFVKNNRSRSRLLERETGDLRRDREAKNSILSTWQISFEYIYNKRRSAADLLALMSLCDQNGIPESLLRVRHLNEDEASQATGGGETETKSVDDGDDDELQDSSEPEYDDDDFEDDIVTLRQYSLISATTDPSVFEMHRLVQFATRTWLEAQDQLEETKDRLCNNLSQLFVNGKFENWPLCEALLPHVKSAMELKPRNRTSLLQWATILNIGADYSYNRGEASDTEAMAVQSYKVRAELLGYRDWRTLSSIELWALAWTLSCRWQDAYDLEEQVLELNKQVLGEEHKGTLASMCNLARLLANLGRLEEAEKLNHQAFDTMNRTLGPQHEYTISTQENLATLYGRRGNFVEAEKVRLQVLEAREAQFGSDWPATILAMSNLAVAYQYQERWDAAEKFESKALDASKRVLGSNHPDTLTCMCNLGATYGQQGRFVEAERLERQVLESRKKVLGNDHPDTLLTMANLACTLSSLGGIEEALELISDCVARSKRIQGPDHDRTRVWSGFLEKWSKQDVE